MSSCCSNHDHNHNHHHDSFIPRSDYTAQEIQELFVRWDSVLEECGSDEEKWKSHETEVVDFYDMVAGITSKCLDEYSQAQYPGIRQEELEFTDEDFSEILKKLQEAGIPEDRVEETFLIFMSMVEDSLEDNEE